MQTIASPRAKRIGVLGGLALAAAIALAGCAALPGQVDRPISHARVDSGDTGLAKVKMKSRQTRAFIRGRLACGKARVAISALTDANAAA